MQLVHESSEQRVNFVWELFLIAPRLFQAKNCRKVAYAWYDTAAAVHRARGKEGGSSLHACVGAVPRVSAIGFRKPFARDKRSITSHQRSTSFAAAVVVGRLVFPVYSSVLLGATAQSSTR